MEEILPGLIKDTDISQLLDSVERMGKPTRGMEMKESIFKSLLNKGLFFLPPSLSLSLSLFISLSLSFSEFSSCH